jgi:segregation and condensation protein B
MDKTEAKYVIEAALLAAGRPLNFDQIADIFSRKGVDVDRTELRESISLLEQDYAERGIELKQVASGYRVQVRRATRDWLDPLFEERAPRYTRALLETLALVAYRQPITRAEIEEVRGVVVSTNIVRTLIERGWVRIVGHREVPGKPSMLGTTKEFLDYFGLNKLEDLPPLSELRDLGPTTGTQSDLILRLEEATAFEVAIGVSDKDKDNGWVAVDEPERLNDDGTVGDAADGGDLGDVAELADTTDLEDASDLADVAELTDTADLAEAGELAETDPSAEKGMADPFPVDQQER